MCLFESVLTVGNIMFIYWDVNELRGMKMKNLISIVCTSMQHLANIIYWLALLIHCIFTLRLFVTSNLSFYERLSPERLHVTEAGFWHWVARAHITATSRGVIVPWGWWPLLTIGPAEELQCLRQQTHTHIYKLNKCKVTVTHTSRHLYYDDVSYYRSSSDTSMFVPFYVVRISDWVKPNYKLIISMRFNPSAIWKLSPGSV